MEQKSQPKDFKPQAQRYVELQLKKREDKGLSSDEEAEMQDIIATTGQTHESLVAIAAQEMLSRQ